MKEKIFNCHKISEGCIEGEVIISKDDIMFYLIKPETGEVLEAEHDLEGKSIANKILIFYSLQAKYLLILLQNLHLL